MKPLLEEHATLLDLADLAGRCDMMHWLTLKEMRRNGDTWSLRLGEQLLGVVGVYRSSFANEAWFAIRPQAGPHMLYLTRRIRLTLDARKYPDLVTVCRSEAGKRIARMCGFRFSLLAQNLEIWEWINSSEAAAVVALNRKA